MDKKDWWKSKTIWGAVCSAIALVVLAFAEFFGWDVSRWLEIVATILGVFGVPFTIYGRKKAIGGIK